MNGVNEENDVVFQNDLIKIIWNDTRLVLLDSDGEFVDYFFDCCFYEEEEQNEMIQSIINDVDGLDEAQLCRVLSDSLDFVLKIEPFGGDDETLPQESLQRSRLLSLRFQCWNDLQ